jgi:hypothetical protein
VNESAGTAITEGGGAERRLRLELDRWRETRLALRVFIRDDDATEDTLALRRLLAILDRCKAPLLLAVIPEPAHKNLAALLEHQLSVTPAVHGFRHQNHAPFGERSRELGSRPVEDVLAELRQGREKLAGMFGENLSDILVPPWNRIDADVAKRVREAGFTAISAHGWEAPEDPTPRINTHVDIMHWSGGRVGRDHDWIFDELAKNLSVARERGGAPVGLLTHHLAHDEQAWKVLEDAMAVLQSGGAQWLAADTLLPVKVPG